MKRYLMSLLCPVLLIACIFSRHVLERGEIVTLKPYGEEGNLVGWEEQSEEWDDTGLSLTQEVNVAQDKTITKAGTYTGDPHTVYDNVVVKSSGVHLRDVQIRGNLVFDKSLNGASVSLENVTVLGNVYLYGSGGCRYTMRNVTLENIVVSAQNSGTELELGGTVSVGQLEIGSDLTVVGDGILKTSARWYAVDQITIPQLQVHRVYVELQNVAVQGMTIWNIATVTLDRTSHIYTAAAYAKVDFQGAGKVSQLKAGADGICYETEPGHVILLDGVEQPVLLYGAETLTEENKYRRLSAPSGLQVQLDPQTGQYTASWEAVEGAQGYRVVCYLDGVSLVDTTLDSQQTQVYLIEQEEYERTKPDSLRVEVFALGDTRETYHSFISSVEYTYDSL